MSAPVSAAHLIAGIKHRFIRKRVRRWLSGGAVFDGVKDVVPFTLVPWPLARSSLRLMKSYSTLMFASPAHKSPLGLSGEDAACLIVDEPRFAGLVAQTYNCPVVYRATDLYGALRNDPKIIYAERLICARANLLVATSARVAEHLRNVAGKPVHIITNGVDFDHFASSGSPATSHYELPGGRSDRAVYVGAFDRRFSLNAFRSAAVRLPEKYFILAGPGSGPLAAGLGLRNVLALGAVPYAVLPDILQRCAVGLLPMSGNAANEGRSPMKFYEYAAAGASVAATASEELERRHLPTLCVSRSEDEFHLAVAEAFERGKDASLVHDARELARLEEWQGKAMELLRLIGAESFGMSASPPGRPVSTAHGARVG